jgi:hypothetical protein
MRMKRQHVHGLKRAYEEGATIMRDLEIGIERLEGLRLGRGRVEGFSENGRVLVEGSAGSGLLSCLVLAMSAGGAPVLAPGDRVLVAAGDDAGDAVVLGVVGPCAPAEPAAGPRARALPGAVADRFDTGYLESARVHAARVQVHADEELELTCGKASIMMKREGKVVVRGTNLVSRSSGPHKIKGASVAIN